MPRYILQGEMIVPNTVPLVLYSENASGYIAEHFEVCVHVTIAENKISGEEKHSREILTINAGPVSARPDRLPFTVKLVLHTITFTMRALSLAFRILAVGWKWLRCWLLGRLALSIFRRGGTGQMANSNSGDDDVDDGDFHFRFSRAIHYRDVVQRVIPISTYCTTEVWVFVRAVRVYSPLLFYMDG